MNEEARPGFTPTGTINSSKDQRRVVFATVVGTTVEWYDFFLYASAAGLVFTQLFFEPAGSEFGAILAFLSVGISFLFRPLGAILAGHFGDKYGRRVVLVATLILMGIATALIGLLPTYEAVGLAAPILLVTLRILQGLSAGGEWGGAALLAVEHAPKNRRSLFGSSPQIGVPLGLLLSSGVLAIMAWIAPGDAFVEWGWRIPFIFSIVLVFIGHWIRRKVEESPVYTELAERKEESSAPLGKLFRNHWHVVLIGALILMGNQTSGYMTTGGYIQRYATNEEGPLSLPVDQVLWAVTGSAVTWLVFTLIGGWLGDKIGRRNTFLVGWVVLFAAALLVFPLVNTGSIWLLFLGLAFLTVGLGFTYGPLSALLAETFPASVRFSGVSISYALGAILGGAFAPTIAQWLYQATDTTWSIAIYLVAAIVLSSIATLLLKDRSGIPLGPDFEEQQADSPLYGMKSKVGSCD